MIEEHPPNAQAPIEVILSKMFCMVDCGSEAHSLNAPSPIEVTVFGMLM
jgi:hypothetical protein